MQIGRLDQQIILQTLVETNAGGQLIKQYTNAATVWAHIISQRGSEAFEAARQTARQILRVAIRYRTDITAEWRVSWEGQLYNVIALDRSQRRDGYLWLTLEGVNVL